MKRIKAVALSPYRRDERPSSRRRFIGKMALAGTALGMPLSGFPNITGKARPHLRVLGTHVTLQEAIRRRAEADLGIRISFQPGGSAEVLHQATTRPESFDIYEQWSNSLKVLWNAQTIQPLRVDRITYWNEINDLPKNGRIAPGTRPGRGDAPHKLLYVQEDGGLGSLETERTSFLPYVHNTDSFGYDTRFIPPETPYEGESWGWLLDEKWRGRVALVNAPTIGLFDAALAVQAKGLMRFEDIGNMTRSEIDQLFDILVDYRRNGHFRGFWTSVPHSVELMDRGEVVIQSMFSPGVSTLNGMGIPCRFAAPKEGYRAWYGVMCLSSAARGEAEEAAYAFMNWWLSGWPGAFIARQGYYISNPSRSRGRMEKAEWDFWYAGKPAAKELMGTDGKVCVRPGEVRNGGSYTNRFSKVAVWNTVMDLYEYTLLRWKEFLLA